MLTQLMIVLDMTVVAVTLPSMQSDLGMTAAQRPWVITAYALAFGGLVLFGGQVQTAIGLPMAYRVGLTGFALASLAAGLSPSFAALAASRAAQGAFAALLAPTLLALVNRVFTETVERRRAFAVLGSTSGLGAAIGLLLGGGLTEVLDWRWTMYVNVPISGAALLVSIISLSASGPRVAARRLLDDALGLFLACGAIFLLVYGCDRAQQDGWTARSTLICLMCGSALLIGFLVREGLADAPVLPLGMLGSASRAASYAAMFVSTFAQMGCIVYLTFYFQNCFGYSPMKTGVVFLPMVGALTLTAVIAGRTLVPRFGARFCFPVGLAVEAAGIGVLSTVTEGDPYSRVMLPGLLILGAGFGLVLPVVFNAGTRGIPPERAGLASAVIATCQQLGSSFGVALLSTFAARHATAYLNAHMNLIRVEATRKLAETHVLPTSAEGRRIVAVLARKAAVSAQIDAYGAGFALLAVIVASAALLLGIAALLHRPPSTDAQPVEDERDEAPRPRRDASAAGA